MNRVKLLAAVLDVVTVLDKHLGTVDAAFDTVKVDRLNSLADRMTADIHEHQLKLRSAEAEIAHVRACLDISSDETTAAGVQRVVDELSVRDGEALGAEGSFDPDAVAGIRKALCVREGESTLAAAERNRDRIIELAREIDEYDRQVAKAMHPIAVAPGKVVEVIGKLQAELRAVKQELADTTTQLLDLKGVPT